LLLGAVGLPVFSGFQGGFGILLGVTGGYLWGFLAAALVYWVVTAVFPKLAGLPAMILGLLTCYACGTGWFLHVYAGSSPMGLGAVLLKCVVPYLLPDAAKIVLAAVLTRRLYPILHCEVKTV
jgi:biotin transport system substrate-specific component